MRNAAGELAKAVELLGRKKLRQRLLARACSSTRKTLKPCGSMMARHSWRCGASGDKKSWQTTRVYQALPEGKISVRVGNRVTILDRMPVAVASGTGDLGCSETSHGC